MDSARCNGNPAASCPRYPSRDSLEIVDAIGKTNFRNSNDSAALLGLLPTAICPFLPLGEDDAGRLYRIFPDAAVARSESLPAG
ncbi:hypothetical protein GTA08_BOTSDO09552 [Botryosphaeria dothidea]|uniref:Uncharacterized protein n=1 Tax=Botryosphaeria dothidea TaxID=55169 RepID=A0A8H4N123_9PEZI|nr:hypothetical protein GTA08_BOTSDO09552 [Botryosphaeria dothidea]